MQKWGALAVISGIAASFAWLACSDHTCEEESTCAASPTNEGGVATESGASSSDDSGLEAAAPTCGVANLPCCGGTSCQGELTCNNGTCGCTAGTACGTSCVDVQTNTKHCGRCDHDCFNGTCEAGKCQPYTIATGQLGSGLLATEDRLFWVRGTGAVIRAGLLSAKLDGSDLKAHYTAGQEVPCRGIGRSNDKIFFNCALGPTAAQHEIRSCALPQCDSTTQFVANAPIGAEAIAVTPEGKVFYVIETPYGQDNGGGVFELGGGMVGNADQPSPQQLLLSNGYLYWACSGTFIGPTPKKNGGIFRARLNALATQETVVLAGGSIAELSNLRILDQIAYFKGVESTPVNIYTTSVNSAGGGAAPLVNDTGAYHIEVDTTNLYITTSTEIRYCPRANCTPATMQTLAKEYAYTAILGANSIIYMKADGTIRRVALP
jgi:hypothetical protein